MINKKAQFMPIFMPRPSGGFNNPIAIIVFFISTLWILWFSIQTLINPLHSVSTLIYYGFYGMIASLIIEVVSIIIK